MTTVQNTPVAVAERVNAEMNRLIAGAPRDGEGEGLSRMLDRILSATSIEDLAGMNEKMDNSRDVARQGDILITSITARDSDIEDAPLGIYLAVSYHRVGKPDTGDVFNTGALSMVAMLLKLHDLELFPVEARVEVKALKGGNSASNLVLL